MNDTIEILALWMGAEKVDCKFCKTTGLRKRGDDTQESKCFVCGGKGYKLHKHVEGMLIPINNWNPTIDWSDWRNLELKLMEDEILWHSFSMAVDKPPASSVSFWYAKADLPTRCKALLSVLPKDFPPLS